jgi:hypothetical protein
LVRGKSKTEGLVVIRFIMAKKTENKKGEKSIANTSTTVYVPKGDTTSPRRVA